MAAVAVVCQAQDPQTNANTRDIGKLSASTTVSLAKKVDKIHFASYSSNRQAEINLKVNLAGTAGGQTINGGTAAGESLTLTGTSSATKSATGIKLGSVVTVDEVNGRVGVGTTTPTSILALGGTAARTIQMERNTTAATAGQGLTVSSGGAIAGTADLAGGDLALRSGISTGVGSSAIRFLTPTPGATGTADNALAERANITSTGLAVTGAISATTGSFTSLTLGATSVTATGAELNYVAGVTSAIQTQLNGKSPTAGPGSAQAFTVGALSATTFNTIPISAGAGAVATNTAVGVNALAANTSGYYNTATGMGALQSNTTGYSNTANGTHALVYNTTGYSNTANGLQALYFNTAGYYNTANGMNAGVFTSTGGNNITSNSSVYLGYDTRALADGDTNEIVIGVSAVGNGSNTVTLGNSSITKTYLKGIVKVSGGYTVATLPAGVTGARAYVTDAAAPTYNGALTGGGTVVVPVFYNGSAWVSA